MTLNDALERAAAAIDAAILKRMDADELHLIEAGVSLDDAADLLVFQRDVYAQWRGKTLADVRTWLMNWDIQ
jgi:hypothetical protein